MSSIVSLGMCSHIADHLREISDDLLVAAAKSGDSMDCTPELRHAARRLIGDTLGPVDASLWISSRRAAGVW
jgi:hypothetical protein